MQPFPFLFNRSYIWQKYLKTIENYPKEAQPLALREHVTALSIVSALENTDEYDAAMSLLDEYVSPNKFFSLFKSYLRRAIIEPEFFLINLRHFTARPALVITQRNEQRQFFEFVEACSDAFLRIAETHPQDNSLYIIGEFLRFLRLPIEFLKPDRNDETVIVAGCNPNGNLILEKALYPDFFPVVLQHIFLLNDPDKTPAAALANEFYEKNGIQLSGPADFARVWYQIEEYNETCRKRAISSTPPTPFQT